MVKWLNLFNSSSFDAMVLLTILNTPIAFLAGCPALTVTRSSFCSTFSAFFKRCLPIICWIVWHPEKTKNYTHQQLLLFSNPTKSVSPFWRQLWRLDSPVSLEDIDLLPVGRKQCGLHSIVYWQRPKNAAKNYLYKNVEVSRNIPAWLLEWLCAWPNGCRVQLYRWAGQKDFEAGNLRSSK